MSLEALESKVDVDLHADFFCFDAVDDVLLLLLKLF